MFLYWFYLSCIIQTLLLLKFYIVLGKREPLPRFIIEQDLKFPIFGSYNYDPIRQLFDKSNSLNETEPSQIYNNSYILSTAVGGGIHQNNETTKHIMLNSSTVFFRKHVKLVTAKTTQWWARSKATYNNLTKYKHFK